MEEMWISPIMEFIPSLDKIFSAIVWNTEINKLLWGISCRILSGTIDNPRTLLEEYIWTPATVTVKNKTQAVRYPIDNKSAFEFAGTQYS